MELIPPGLDSAIQSSPPIRNLCLTRYSAYTRNAVPFMNTGSDIVKVMLCCIVNYDPEYNKEKRNKRREIEFHSSF